MMVHTCKPRVWEVEAGVHEFISPRFLKEERRSHSNKNKSNTRKQGGSALLSLCVAGHKAVSTLDFSGPQGMYLCLAGNKLQILVGMAKYREAAPQLTHCRRKGQYCTT